MTRESVQTLTITQSGEARAPIETTPGRRRHARVAVVAAGVALLLSACSTTMSGMGYGNRAHAGKITEPLQMSRTSDSDPRSGTMTATLPDRTYSGPYFEITQQTRGDSLTSLWNGWGKGWLDWSYWTSTPDEE